MECGWLSDGRALTPPAGPSALAPLGVLELCPLPSHTCRRAGTPLVRAPVVRSSRLCQGILLRQTLR